MTLLDAHTQTAEETLRLFVYEHPESVIWAPHFYMPDDLKMNFCYSGKAR